MNIYTDSEIDQIARTLDDDEEQTYAAAAETYTHAILASFAKWGQHASLACRMGLTMHDVMAAMRWPDLDAFADDVLAKETAQFSAAYGWAPTLRCLARAIEQEQQEKQ